MIVVRDTITADTAYRYVCEGTALLWRGDFQNARQLLDAMARRVDRKSRKAMRTTGEQRSPADVFHRYRMDASRRARLLGMLLIELEPDCSIPLKRAPDAERAILEAFGRFGSSSVIPMREILGAIGAHEWRKKGVEIPFLEARVHPHYGVFSPIRREFVDLVAAAPLPSRDLAFDIGTGTGVLAAVLAKRGVERVVATDVELRAVTCARENIERLGFAGRVEVVQADLFPDDGEATKAPLIVCNPPWIPSKAVTSLERAVYDPKGGMLHGFIKGLSAHLTSPGEAWLLLSDLAEHLGLRSRKDLLVAFESADLKVEGKIDVRPEHPRVRDERDPLHVYRREETVSLWRLAHRP